MGTVPTPPTFTAGEKPTAAKMNQAATCMSFLLEPPQCRADHTTQITLTTGTYTVIPLQSETFDIVQSGDSPSHDNVTNNSRIVFRTPGIYEISGQLRFAANSTGARIARVRLNAGGVDPNGTVVIDNVQGPVASPNATSVPIPPIQISVSAGDYIELFGRQESGGNLTTWAVSPGDCFLKARWVGQ